MNKSSYSYHQQTSVYGVCEEKMKDYDKNKCSWLFSSLVPFTRFWGVATAVVLCGVGVDIAYHRHIIGVYYTISSVVIFVLEISWVVTIFLQVLPRNELSTPSRCWNSVLWFDLWKRSILYCFTAAILFLRPHNLWLAGVSGVQLLILALCYLVLTFQPQYKVDKVDRLLVNHSVSHEPSSERFDDVSDILDDTLLQPPTPNDIPSDVENDAIMEM